MAGGTAGVVCSQVSAAGDTVIVEPGARPGSEKQAGASEKKSTGSKARIRRLNDNTPHQRSNRTDLTLFMRQNSAYIGPLLPGETVLRKN